MSRPLKKIFSVGLVIGYATTQVALGSVAESNFWAERRRQTFSTAPLLNQLPSVVPTLSNLPRWNSSGPKRFPRLSQSLQALTDSISLANGNIQQIYDAGPSSRPPVVLIQDVHLNGEAQVNIVALLQQLIDQKQAGLVGVEGAFGPFDFGPFRAFPDKQITRDVTEAFLKQSRLAAPSFVGITSTVEPPVFLGVDNRPHYDANVNAYLSSRPLKEKVKQEVAALRSPLAEAKKKLFSPTLLKFDDFRSAYQAGKIGLGVYLQRLATMRAIPSPLPIVVDQFLEAYDMETKLDFQRVEHERRQVIEKLTQALNKDEISDLVAQSLAYRMGKLGFGDYYQGLKELCGKKRNSPESNPRLR